ncbi:zinc-binding dehydrogenase [Streptomyces sp. NPDC012935]|uniref:zinc-binding dehydrogenase n=1 Tax=Streptomyces sp. NPDC012935 TaxID=3364857 RepID=UPI00368642EA
MDTMLAGRLHLMEKEFRVEEVPVPVPGPGEVLVQVKAAGVCLSDLHLIDGSISPQYATADTVTLGHEVAGVVHSLGPHVAGDWTPGKRVLLLAGQRCGLCESCVTHRPPCVQPRTRGVDYDGGWAQFTVAREETLVAIPDSLPFDQASIIPDAVSTSYAALVATADVRPAQAVGIWGVGGLGAHAVRIARVVGAAPVIAIDPLPRARERALSFGADLALDPADPRFADSIAQATSGRGLDAAFDFAGAPVVREQAIAGLARGGSLVLVGLTPHPLSVADGTAFSLLGHRICGHYGSTPEHIVQLVRLASTGRLDLGPSVSALIPLSEAASAVERLANKIGDPIRLVLTP